MKPPQNCNFISSYDGTTQTYLLDVPDQHPPRGIVVYLHGAGSNQDQGMDEQIFNGTFGWCRQWLYEKGWVYACPEYRGKDSWMNQSAEADVTQLITLLHKQFKISKLILSGGSMGGTSAFIYAVRNPRMIGGVIAFCPATDMADLYRFWGNYQAGIDSILAGYGGTPSEKPEIYSERCSYAQAEKLKGLPVYLSHGSEDAAIPVGHSRRMAEALKKYSVDFCYEEIPGGSHDAPINKVFSEKAFLWMMEKL